MGKLTKKEILDLLREQRSTITSKYPIKSLALFGSYARNEEVSGSDIDLLVEFNGPIGLEIVDLVDDLEKILQKHKIDLVSKRAIKPHYLPYIEKDLIYV